MPGRTRCSASQSGLARSSGRAKVTGIDGYHSQPMVSPFLPDAEKVAAIRAAIPATGAGIYLNTGMAGPLASETVAAMRQYEDWQLRVGRGDPDDQQDHLERLDEC